jgi:hypothetical protein
MGHPPVAPQQSAPNPVVRISSKKNSVQSISFLQNQVNNIHVSVPAVDKKKNSLSVNSTCVLDYNFENNSKAKIPPIIPRKTNGIKSTIQSNRNSKILQI